jgi:hypothetical protein
MTIAEYLEAKGQTRAQKMIATNMLRKGFNPEEIANITGLNLKEIQSLETVSSV